jgi:heme exporter protein C
VEWWNTLHQTASVTKFDKPSMDTRMLIPLLLMALSFKLYYGAVVLMRARAELLERDRNTRWVLEMVEEREK